MTLVSAGFAADGELRYDFNCDTCGNQNRWRIFATQIAFAALSYDLEGRLERHVHVAASISEADKNWLHQQGIGGVS